MLAAGRHQREEAPVFPAETVGQVACCKVLHWMLHDGVSLILNPSQL